jgi:hypothetical protein
MTARPHTISDLHLAPVVLALDARVAELGSLTPAQLAEQVAIVGGKPEWTRAFREAGLLTTVSQPIDLHDWTVSWDSRGLRVANGTHHVSIGLPATFNDYLSAANVVTAGHTG